MILIKKFAELGRGDASIAGGKGASLGEMTQAGIPVPGGFVVLSSAFERFLEETDLNVEIDSIIKGVDTKAMHTVEHASETIQKLILKADMPEDIKVLIRESFQELESKFVAVRSSATAEDSASAAWAGQLDSFLNTTEATLLENVQRCWASLFTPRAIFYRFEQGLHESKISVAVVVQKIVESEVSGIAFSVHPVTEDRNQLIIEAGFGLGEAIVSGQITPDSYVVGKIPREIIDINVSTQTRALYRIGEGGGNEWRTIAEPKASSQVLTETQILELSELIIHIESHYGFPCDIEWAYEKGKFYIVQSRPITTLSETKNPHEFYKIMTRPLSLVDCECWDIGERVKLPELFHNLLFFDPLFIYTPNKAVAVYYDFTDPKQNPQPLLDFLGNNLEWFKKEKVTFDKKCESLREMMESKSPDYEKIAELNHEIWPVIAVANFYGSTEYFKVPDDLRQLCIQIREESDDVVHPSLTYINKVISKEFKTNTQNITLSEFLNNEVPEKLELDKRVNGWAFHNGRIILDVEKYYKEANIQIQKIDPSTEGQDTIIGRITSKGLVTGKVKVIYELSDLIKIQEGDILITPMTTPEMIPALQKASAIVTDEGGITCHAAIVSRELKKPCIIGTKIATQVLKDGDLVEVDADNGVVRVVERAYEKGKSYIVQSKPITTLTDRVEAIKYFKKDDYILSFWAQGVSIFVTDIHLDVYSHLGILFIIDNGMFKQYFLKTAYEQALEDGLKFYSDEHAVKEYKKDLKNHCTELETFFNTKVKGHNNIPKETLKKFFAYTQKLVGDYTKMNFEYTDKAFAEREKNKIIEVNLSIVAKFKDEVRAVMNKTLFEADGYLPYIWKVLSKQLSVTPSLLDNLTQAEILALYDGQHPDIDRVSKRQKAFIYSYQSRISFEGKDAQEIIKTFEEKVGETDVLSGQVASKGKVQGKVKIIPVDYSDFGRVNREIGKMQQDDILIAETTAPELIVACKKAGAIVTDMGGLMSHAAIVSRELGIPCVVGTKVATQVLKDGDLVEVDADNGIVRILR